jgi:O-antigen/teichoic acid export membrane protein
MGVSVDSNSKLAEKTGVVVFARIFTTFVELGTAIALVRLLSDTHFAIISFLLLVYETAKYVATLGFPDSIFYFFERVAHDTRAGFAYMTCAIMGVTGMAAFGLMFAFQGVLPAYLSNWAPESIAMAQQLLPVMAWVALLEIPTWPVGNILLAADRQRSASWYQLINGTATFGALIGPISMGYGLDVALYALLAVSGIRFAGSFIWLWMVLPPYQNRPGRALFREQVVFSVPIGISALVSRINRYADKFIVSYFLAEATVAQYNVGAQEIPIVRVIPFAVGSVLISRFVQFQMEDKRDELRELWHKGIEKVSLIVLPLTLFFIATGSEFITILFGEGYREAVLPFQIYTLTVLIRVTNYGSILQAFGDTKGILRLSLNLMVLKIALGIAFTVWFGIIGTAVSSVLAHGLNWLLYLRRIGGHMALPWYEVIPFKSYARILGVSAVTALLVWISIRSGLPVHGIGAFIASMALFLVVFVGLGRFTGILSAQDLRFVRDWFRLKFLIP